MPAYNYYLSLFVRKSIDLIRQGGAQNVVYNRHIPNEIYELYKSIVHLLSILYI